MGFRLPEKGFLFMQSIVSIKDYLRPWKLFTLFCGIALLIIGSFAMPAIDWDIPISFIMGLATYIFAPITARSLFRRYWHWLPLGVFGAWLSIDGVYWAYWAWQNPYALDAMRSIQWQTSVCLYGLCACLWYKDCSLKALLRLKK